ncbi:MAG: type II secretion system protein, partial [Gaiellales bacterium]|nr:type II secretion system protein [Gaiellales bacterium]
MIASRLVHRRKALLATEGGFTLIELLVVILVAGVLTSAILGVFVASLRAFTVEGIRIQNQ